MSITDTQFEQGIAAYRKQDYQGAETLFLEVLAIEPFSSETMLNLGNVYYQLERFDEAEAQWQRAVQSNPLEEKAYLNLGNLYYSRSEYSKAVDMWEIFRKLCPEHKTINLNLGLAYETMGDIPEAFRYFRMFLSAKANVSDRIKLKKRIAELEKVAAHNLKQAEQYMREGQLQHAKNAYAMGINLVPVHPKAYKHYATVLYQVGDYAEAARWYEQAHTHIPRDTGILINMGVLYEKLDQPLQALWAYYTAMQINPNNLSGKVKARFQAIWNTQGTALIDVGVAKIQTYITTQRYQKAERLAQRLFDVAMGIAPDKTGEIKRLITFLEDRQNPRKLAANIAYALAEEYRGQGQYEKALPFYDRYLTLLPKGEHADEVREKQDQIQKTITAIVGTLLTGGRDESAA